MKLSEKLKKICSSIEEGFNVGDNVIFKKGSKYEGSVAIVQNIVNPQEVDLKFGGGFMGAVKISDLEKKA
jgi:hypothetical protein